MCFPSEGSKGSECNDISKVKQACSSELPTPPFDCGDQQDLPDTKIIFGNLVQVFSQVKINYSSFLPTFITQNDLTVELMVVYQNAKIINGIKSRNKKKGCKLFK